MKRAKKTKSPIRIGVSSCFFHADPKRAIFKGKTLLYAEESLIHWLQSAGVIPYLIPSFGSKLSPKQIARDLDALVLQGGSDVAPESYGESALKPEWSGDRVRDQYESALLKAFMKEKKPVLGVCRGLQLANVALGGTLFQDLTTQRPSPLTHRDWEIYDQNFHDVTFETGGRLSKIYKGATRAKINSVHHQGIQKLGKDLRIEAIATDGVVEAVSLKSPSQYLVCVQWHPEFQDPKSKDLLSSQALLKDFVSAVKESL